MSTKKRPSDSCSKCSERMVCPVCHENLCNPINESTCKIQGYYLINNLTFCNECYDNNQTKIFPTKINTPKGDDKNGNSKTMLQTVAKLYH